MSNIEQHSDYLFVFAHPDDEVYSCGLMHRLIKNGKAVTAAFMTSGDAGANPELRETELKASMDAIGVPEDNTLLLGFSEKKILESFPTILDSLKATVSEVTPDCVVGMDFEGGHEVHDSASFLTTQAVVGLSVARYVFPVYHADGGKREAATFVPGRTATDTIELTPEEVGVKIAVLEAHIGQIGHFLNLQRQSPEYFQRLFGREVFREIVEPIDYTQRPAIEVGYESHRNGFKFTDFKQSVEGVLN